MVTTDWDAMNREHVYEVMRAYLDGHDPRWLADDAVLTDTASGSIVVGRDLIAQLFNDRYHVALDATLEITNLLVSDGKAACEATVVGRHVGDLLGLPATGQDVRIPLAVVYDLEEGRINHVTSYLQISTFQRQVLGDRDEARSPSG